MTEGDTTPTTAQSDQIVKATDRDAATERATRCARMMSNKLAVEYPLPVEFLSGVGR